MLQIGSLANYIQICHSLTKPRGTDPHTDLTIITFSLNDPLAARTERIRRNQTHIPYRHSMRSKPRLLIRLQYDVS